MNHKKKYEKKKIDFEYMLAGINIIIFHRVFDAAEGQRVAVFRADAGRRDGRGRVLLRRLDAAAAVVQ